MMISFRLSKDEDEDLIKKIKSIPKQVRSMTYREALRSYFYQDKKGVMHVTSKVPALQIELNESEKKKKLTDVNSALDDLLGKF